MVSLPGVKVASASLEAVGLGVDVVPAEQAASASEAPAIAMAAKAFSAVRREVVNDMITFQKGL